jgi:hypothetical protein
LIAEHCESLPPFSEEKMTTLGLTPNFRNCDNFCVVCCVPTTYTEPSRVKIFEITTGGVSHLAVGRLEMRANAAKTGSSMLAGDQAAVGPCYELVFLTAYYYSD